MVSQSGAFVFPGHSGDLANTLANRSTYAALIALAKMSAAQVANALRAAILTRQLQPGEKLPSGTELAKTYGVARMTVQQAIRVLRDEGLIVSRQGSGVFVRESTERPVELRPRTPLNRLTSQSTSPDSRVRP